MWVIEIYLHKLFAFYGQKFPNKLLSFFSPRLRVLQYTVTIVFIVGRHRKIADWSSPCEESLDQLNSFRIHLSSRWKWDDNLCRWWWRHLLIATNETLKYFHLRRWWWYQSLVCVTCHYVSISLLLLLLWQCNGVSFFSIEQRGEAISLFPFLFHTSFFGCNLIYFEGVAFVGKVTSNVVIP